MELDTRKLLAHAAVRVGGVNNLAAKLGVSSHVVSRYLTGKENIPESLFLVLVDLILEALPREEPNPPASQSLPNSTLDP